ncbi:hypothetical protein BC830DRAFT_1148567 [Chytriomyces sp. MP71]|nr:hypothetical protein BC830DRAFT_1148567 [Chytriomyces sp. MP71]
MSQIEALAIRGIRSFGPDDICAIEFYTPLTLIVGHNGAGKTTIIECLKYATIGDLPPNSQKSFVHDPRVANMTEVKAQVKLKFKNVNGKKLTITRSLVVTQKKSVTSQKTLESLLATDLGGGKSVSITSKCAELDAAIPEQLGVSRAILDNVIFCHQEDSYWPLAEPGTLKKKFDEIFASTRYTKALESIKQLRKDQASQIKVDQNELEHLKADKERADRLETDKAEIDEKIEEAVNRKQVLEGGEIEQVHRQLRNLEREQQQIQNVYAQVQQHEMKRNMLATSINELKESIELYEDSDDQLKTMLDQFQDSVAKHEQDLAQLEDLASEATIATSRKEHDISKLHTLKGQMQAEVEAHARRIKKGEDTFDAIAKSANIRGFSAPFSEEDVSKFFQKVNDALESQLQDFEAVKAEAQVQESAIQTRLQKAQTSISSQNETKKMLKRQMDNARQKIADTNSKMHSLNVSQSDISDAQSRVTEESEWLSAFKAGYNPTETEAKIKNLNAEISRHEISLSRLSEEMSSLNLQADTRARLNAKKADKKRAEDKFKGLNASFEDSYHNSFNQTPNMSTCANEISTALRNKERASAAAKSTFDGHVKEMSTLEGKLSMTKNRLQTLTEDIQKRSRTISEACPPGTDFQMALKEAEEQYEEELSSGKTIDSANTMLNKYVRLFNKNKCCPLCSRKFPDEDEGQKFVTLLREQIQRLPSREAHSAILAEKTTNLKKFQSLQTLFSEISRLRDQELPLLKQSVKDFEREREAGHNLLEDLEGEAASLAVEVKSLTDLRAKCDELLRVEGEMRVMDGDISALQQELSMSGSMKTINEVQEEYDQTQTKCKTLRRDVERLNNELRARQRELQLHENLHQEAKAQLQQKQYVWQERERLQSSIADMKIEMERYSKDIEVAESVIIELAPTVRSIEDELSAEREKTARTISEHQKIIQEYRSHISQICSFQEEMKRFKDSNVPARLERCSVEVNALRTEIQSLQEQKEGAASRIAAIQKSTSEVAVIQRGISDNLKYRSQLRALDEVEAEIVKLKADAGKFDIRSVQAKRKQFTEQYERLSEELAGLSGELKQLEEHAKRIDRDLTGNFANVSEKHTRQVIKLKTESLAIQDLEKYSKALENAIMKYHTMKMDEINKIIRELWVNTYKGNDIETIEIRSDNEGSAKNRSYNYRVVMIKEQTELDMRGRCSAGQKVLACLIIRLALAETFCLNCGILALDEPTTNLDRDNSEALAESLSNIIKLRRAQKNFQLIIITHDEDFMNQIGHHDYADYYWRVSKDAMQHSIIEKQSITF